MNKIFFLIVFLLSVRLSIGQGIVDTIIKTPNNVSMSVTGYYPYFFEDEGEIEAATRFWQNMIDDSFWHTTIISPPSVTYNCHGYAWHVSDGGMHVVLTGSGNVEKYFSGSSPTYAQTTEIDTLEKIFYFYTDHSAVTSNDPNYVISKWGGGPLVRHHPEDCPFDADSLIYYKLDIAGDNSMSKGTATNVTTLDI